MSRLARSRLTAGSFLSMISTARLLSGLCVRDLADGDRSAQHRRALPSLPARFSRPARISSRFFPPSPRIADQALFLTDLIAFFEMQPTIASKPNALPAPRPIRHGFEFRNVSFRYPGQPSPGSERFELSSASR